MYHPRIVAARAAKLEAAFGCELREHSPDEVQEWIARLKDAEPRKGKHPRPLTNEEASFIRNELLLSKASFEYWGTRYCQVSLEAAAIGPMFPLLGSQRFLQDRIADLELEVETKRRHDGIMVACLKGARQVGISTFAEALITHRVTTQDNLNGLIASDEPGPKGSGYMFGMMYRAYEHLPWWLRPRLTDDVKDTEIRTDGGSHVWVGAGKSMKGKEGARGQLGRGMSISVLHLSELSTWENPDQIDDSLLPTVPRMPRVLGIFESTAKGRNNWWHRYWLASRERKNRFVPVFIPWYTRYSLPAPDGWAPAPSTLAHARKVEETSPSLFGKTIHLLRDQLYWYETVRTEYESVGKIREFLEEYGSADDQDCFQHSGRSVISVDIQQAAKDKAKSMIALCEVKPSREVKL